MEHQQNSTSHAPLLREGSIVSRIGPRFARPTAKDGLEVWNLVKKTADLDDNSLYCNLLQCTHFAATSVIARLPDGKIAGWMGGYVPPDQPDTLFVWQVCVAPGARGKGLGKKLIAKVLDRPGLSDIRYVQSTITPDNAKSWGLFHSLATSLDAKLRHCAHFDRHAHFGSSHDSEALVTIGPF